MRLVGMVCVLAAAVLFLAGLVVYVSGNEVAIFALILAFGVLTFGTGALAASRRA